MTTTEERTRESKAVEKILAFGLARELKGTALVKSILTGKKKAEELTDTELEQVYEAYEARRYVPINPEAEKKSRNIYYQQEELNVRHQKDETIKNYRKRKTLKFIAIICNEK